MSIRAVVVVIDDRILVPAPFILRSGLGIEEIIGTLGFVPGEAVVELLVIDTGNDDPGKDITRDLVVVAVLEMRDDGLF